MQILRDGSALDRQHRLDESGHTRRRLQVAQIRFDSTEQKRRALRAAPAQHGAQSPCLDRVAEQRPGPMGLDVVDVMRRQAGVGVRRAQHCHLGRRIGGEQAVGPAVLVDRRAPHHRQHPVPVPHRVTEPLEHHRSAALTTDEPISIGVERMAGTRRRQCTALIETSEHRRRHQQIHSGGDGHPTVLHPQALTRQVQRHQRR